MRGTPRYRLYWSTSPECVGYAASTRKAEEAWALVLARKPDVVSTARGCVDAIREAQRRVGQGTFLGRRTFRAADGTEVPWAVVEDEGRMVGLSGKAA